MVYIHQYGEYYKFLRSAAAFASAHVRLSSTRILQREKLPVDLIEHLVEPLVKHCGSIAEVMSLNPIQI